jgi:stage III sporulation protein AC
MDIGLIVKVAGIGLLVSVSTQLLNKSGRDEQSMLVTLAGILVVLGLLVGKIGELFESIMSLFGL